MQSVKSEISYAWKVGFARWALMKKLSVFERRTSAFRCFQSVFTSIASDGRFISAGWLHLIRYADVLLKMNVNLRAECGAKICGVRSEISLGADPAFRLGLLLTIYESTVGSVRLNSNKTDGIWHIDVRTYFFNPKIRNGYFKSYCALLFQGCLFFNKFRISTKLSWRELWIIPSFTAFMIAQPSSLVWVHFV